MTATEPEGKTAHTLRGLADGRASVRLRSALAAGAAPEAALVDALVERCGLEPDFYVRDMLTWALTRHPVSLTLPALMREAGGKRAQARSQALHTLSKIGDRRAWPAVTPELLGDPDDEVARSAWRAAVVLVPDGQEPELARLLARQLGRGGRETQLSLCRALAALGDAAAPPVEDAASAPAPHVRAHALATLLLMREPEMAFEFAVEEAKRIVALGGGGGEGE